MNQPARLWEHCLTVLVLGVLTLATLHSISRINHRLDTLYHACSPVQTGGGVTQCANPTRTETETRKP